ncbi:MAG: GatB/YqeY domain-containing protein, partial [Anaerolineales bacterium]
KSRRETIEEAKQANRNDLVDSTQAEIDVLQNYLPQPLTPDELETLARQVIDEVEASGPGFVGKVMKVLIPRVQGRADGKVVNVLVRNLLNEL